jgi:hypothetical protein
MTSILSESSSSTTTSILQSPLALAPFHIFPAVTRLHERSYVLGEDPGQAQIRLNRLVAEAFHGESSAELRNAELGRAATRALLNFSINQERDKRRRYTRTDMNEDTEMSSTDRDEGWESIQDYGNFLRETADTFREEALLASPPIRWRTIPGSSNDLCKSQNEERKPQGPPIDGVSWRHFSLNAEFAHLAPLTSRENRVQAQQSANLIEWISDPANNELFGGWSGLDQASKLPAVSEEAQLRRNDLEMGALDRILGGIEDQSTERRYSEVAELGRGATDSQQTLGSFAKYLTIEAPQWSARRLETGVTTVEPSRSSSMGGGSDEDTRSVVSQDNHWRRTIFG